MTEETEQEAAYVCVRCRRDVSLNPIKDRIVCPKCSERVILKKRPKTPKRVVAR